MKVALLGLNVRSNQRPHFPCLPLYNLKLYAYNDEKLKGKVDISIFEAAEEADNNVLLDLLKKNDPDVIGLSCYFWSTKKLLRIVKEYLKDGKSAFVFLGGPDAAYQTEKLLRENDLVSGIVRGEGEEAFRLLLRNVTGVDKKPWQRTPGLVIRKNGRAYENPLPKLLDMDDVPIMINDDWLCMETARGCKYKCTFCINTREKKRRTRSLDSTLKAIDRLVELGGKNVTFIDSSFNQEKKRSKALLKYLAEKNLRLSDLELNAEELDDDEISLLSKLSSTQIEFGLQTTNQITQKNIRRAYNEKKFRERISKVRAHGMRFILDLICGLPGDNYETFKKSYDDAVSMEPDLVNISTLYILPGTELCDKAEKHGISFDKVAPYKINYCDTFGKNDMNKASRFVSANIIISTFNSNSIPFQILCRETKKLPSSLIEKFLSGSWRNDVKITDEELKKWQGEDNANTSIDNVSRFFDHVYINAVGQNAPFRFRDICNLQYELGRIKARYIVEEQNKRWSNTPDLSVKLAPSQNVRLLRLRTDVYGTLRTRDINTIDTFNDEYTMLLCRNEATIKSFKISNTMEKIINFSRDRLSLSEIMDALPNISHKQVNASVIELIKAGALRTIEQEFDC